jgi:antitoxin component of RelBE/YafQ-DinJ toxin-antitoxin module
MKFTTMFLKFDEKVKTNFDNICHSLGIKPMRVVMVLIERFGLGQIDAMPIIEDCKKFNETDIQLKTNRLLTHRINGKQAHEIHKTKHLTNSIKSDNIKL